eukprot:GHVT01009685.1.p1 GENE.GHVT01009685.1~~GHVT01009685.1.p1  ORF type:complete len:194 (-),score=19.43 GHVT01009685.1:747-1328(-)
MQLQPVRDLLLRDIDPDTQRSCGISLGSAFGPPPPPHLPEPAVGRGLPVSPATKPSSSPPQQKIQTFIPLTVKEFNSVPELVRRRAKYEDVNNLFSSLWELALSSGTPGPFTRKQLAEMQLTVVGQTGDAKLQTLRYLKAVEIIGDTSVRLLRAPRFPKANRSGGAAGARRRTASSNPRKPVTAPGRSTYQGR